MRDNDGVTFTAHKYLLSGDMIVDDNIVHLDLWRRKHYPGVVMTSRTVLWHTDYNVDDRHDWQWSTDSWDELVEAARCLA